MICAGCFQEYIAQGSDGIVHYYCISENTYDEALDIFVRVNSTDETFKIRIFCFLPLLMDGRKEKRILKIRLSFNSKGDSFSFFRDYLMRLLLVLADAPTNLKIESFDKKTIQKFVTIGRIFQKHYQYGRNACINRIIGSMVS